MTTYATSVPPDWGTTELRVSRTANVGNLYIVYVDVAGGGGSGTITTGGGTTDPSVIQRFSVWIA